MKNKTKLNIAAIIMLLILLMVLFSVSSLIPKTGTWFLFYFAILIILLMPLGIILDRLLSKFFYLYWK